MHPAASLDERKPVFLLVLQLFHLIVDLNGFYNDDFCFHI